MDSPHP